MTTDDLPQRIQARIDTLQRQRDDLQRQAERDLTALQTAIAELQALLATPTPAAPDTEAP